MDIHQLKTFIAVAREGSITRASERLYLSQPAVSAHIKALEEELGIELFARSARGMQLTPDGERMLVRAERTMASHRELLDEATRIKGRLSGRFRIGAANNSTSNAIGKLIAGLAERHPDVEPVLMHYTAPDDIMEALRAQTLDAGFYNELSEPADDLTTMQIDSFGIFLAAPAQLSLGKEPVDWRTLENLPWILPGPRSCCGSAAEALFLRHQFRPKQVISVDKEAVTRTLIAGGIGVGMLHTSSANEAKALGEVDLLLEARTDVRVVFAHERNRAEDPILRASQAILQEAASTHKAI